MVSLSNPRRSHCSINTVHRVNHTGASERISVPFFLEPSVDAAIESFAGGGESVRYVEHLQAKIDTNFRVE